MHRFSVGNNYRFICNDQLSINKHYIYIIHTLYLEYCVVARENIYIL